MTNSDKIYNMDFITQALSITACNNNWVNQWLVSSRNRTKNI